jgi:hypothetical protein
MDEAGRVPPTGKLAFAATIVGVCSDTHAIGRLESCRSIQV